MDVFITIDLNTDECRPVLNHIVPKTATAVWCTVTAKPGYLEPTGSVRIQYLGRKKDGTPHSRRTGKWWTLTPQWWKALVINNPRLPVSYRSAIGDLVTTRGI